MAAAVAERANLLERCRWIAEHNSRDSSSHLFGRLIAARGIPREKPAILGARISSAHEENGETAVLRSQESIVNCDGDRANRPRPDDRALAHRARNSSNALLSQPTVLQVTRQSCPSSTCRHLRTDRRRKETPACSS